MTTFQIKELGRKARDMKLAASQGDPEAAREYRALASEYGRQLRAKRKAKP